MARKSTVFSRRCVIAFAAMLGLLVGGIAKTEAASYTFTKIADTSGDFSDFFSPPALNDNGVVAFSAKLDSGPSGVFTGEGNGTTTIADSSGAFNIFDSISPSLSDSDVLAFKAFLDAGGNAIVRSDRTTPIASSVLYKGHPSINDEGLVAFYQRTNLFITNIFVSDGTTTTTITPTSTTPFISLGENPSLSDRGAVAFSDETGSGIFRSDGTMTTVIAHTSTSGPYFNLGLFPSLNNEGAVAFFARLLMPAGGSGIFVSDGTTTTTIADSSGPFNSFGNSPSINDKGVVAFWASLKMAAGGGHGIFTGPDPVAHKVIAVGDALDESYVKDLTSFGTFGREGLNNAGQVAFRAQLVDGRIGIYRADPVPSEPEVLKVSIDIKPGGNPNSINLKSQGTVPVAILTTDDFDATTVDPTTVALAGAPVKLKKNGTLMYAYEDANGDGRVDLVVHISTQDFRLDESSPVAVLTGKTFGKMDIITGKTLGGVPITGADTVRIVP